MLVVINFGIIFRFIVYLFFDTNILFVFCNVFFNMECKFI
jgi:hypothetical protein